MRERPGDVAPGDVPAAAGPDGIEDGTGVPRNDEDQVVAEDGTGNSRESVVGDPPHHLPGARIVGSDLVSARTDQLGPPLHLDDQGGGVGHVSRALGLPAEFAVFLVESGHVLNVGPVAGDHEQVLEQHRGAPRTVAVLVLEPRAPKHLSIGRQCGRPVGAVVDVDPFSLQQSGGRRIAVLGVDASRVFAPEDLQVVKQLAGLQVQADDSKGPSLVPGGGEPDPPVLNHR